MGRYKQLNVNIRPDQYSAMLFLKNLKLVPRIAEFVREAIDREVSAKLQDLFVSVVLDKLGTDFVSPIIKEIKELIDGDVRFPALDKLKKLMEMKNDVEEA